MFEFIKKLFKKKEAEDKYITIVRIPRVNTEEVEEIGRIADEIADVDELENEEEYEEALHMALVNVFKRNGWTQKFRDNTTGEIHEVDADDEETFSKMMADKNMTLLLFG